MRIQDVDKNMKEGFLESNDINWYKVNNNNFLIEGIAIYNDCIHRLNNLFINDHLNLLSLHPSGVYVDFITNSKNISIKVKMGNIAYMNHMTAVGQSGFDLYCKINNKFIFINCTKINKIDYELTLLKTTTSKYRYYRLYLPLYSRVESIHIGLDNDSTLKKIEKVDKEKIICYGTSITQGGCATRSGMSYSSILGRMFSNYEVYNFGFSGNAFLDLEVSDFISNMSNLKYLIIEAEANAAGKGTIETNMIKFIDIIRHKHPNIKIYVLSRYPYSLTLLDTTVKDKITYYNDYQKELVLNYHTPLIEFIDGKKILKKYHYEETVDGVHLTDLGFYEVAIYMAKKIKSWEKKDTL